MNKILSVGYILFITGMAVGQVGQMPPSPPEPYSWDLPLSVFCMMLAPSLAAYFAGKEDSE